MAAGPIDPSNQPKTQPWGTLEARESKPGPNSPASRPAPRAAGPGLNAPERPTGVTQRFEARTERTLHHPALLTPVLTPAQPPKIILTSANGQPDIPLLE